MAKRLFEKPCGEAKLGHGFGYCWNNQQLGVDGPVLCEICGTEHPERKDEVYIISWFLGMQVVEECCGAVLDQIYKESGKEFFEALLFEFSRDPMNPRFGILRSWLKEYLNVASKKLSEVSSDVHEMSVSLGGLE